MDGLYTTSLSARQGDHDNSKVTHPFKYLLSGFMTGFRRVVGHSRSEAASPMDDPICLDLYPGVALSPITSIGNPSPRKRKSADANTLGVTGFRYVRRWGCLCVMSLQYAWCGSHNSCYLLSLIDFAVQAFHMLFIVKVRSIMGLWKEKLLL